MTDTNSALYRKSYTNFFWYYMSQGLMIVNSAMWLMDYYVQPPIQHVLEFNILIQHSFVESIWPAFLILTYIPRDFLLAVAIGIAWYVTFHTPYYYIFLAVTALTFTEIIHYAWNPPTSTQSLKNSST